MNLTDDVRTRLLDAAERCFYRHGITATGVDTLAAEAGVSKRTLYNHFGSKEGLVTSYLERREQAWRDRLASRLATTDHPADRLVAYVREYCEGTGSEGFRGCPFINAAAELDDDHPAMHVIQGSLANVEAGLVAILEDLGVQDSREMASRMLVVLEGAMSVSGMRRTEEAWETAERLVMSMVPESLTATRA